MKLNHEVEFTGDDEYDFRRRKHWWWYKCTNCGASFKSTHPPEKQRGHEANWRPRDVD